MKSLFLIAVLSLVVYTTCEGCICQYINLPVCGVNGQTYDNQCTLDCAGVEKLYDGDCPLCACHFDYQVVCDTEGREWPNLCILTCFGLTQANCPSAGQQQATEITDCIAGLDSGLSGRDRAVAIKACIDAALE